MVRLARLTLNLFRFAGEYFDRHRGEYYLRARHFNPTTGRFTQPDPHWTIANMVFGDTPTELNGVNMPSTLAIIQAMNLFVFAMNNPIMWVDPSGLTVRGTKEQHRDNSRELFAPSCIHQNLRPVHAVLDVVGMAPIVGNIADGVNALLYAMTGDYVNAGLSAAAMIPFAGLAVGGGRTAARAGNRLTTNQNQLNKMFRNADGHFSSNTATNRNLIEATANNQNNFMGTDSFGNRIFAETQADGRQVWARVRGDIIREAGINQTPRTFNPQTGLNAPQLPRG